MGDKVREVVERSFKGLDEDLLEYVVSMIEDNGVQDDDSKEQVAAFLQSSEFCETEEEAELAVQNLSDELKQLGIGGDEAAPTDDGPQLLKNVIDMSKGGQNSNNDFLMGASIDSSLDIRNETFQSTGAKVSKREARRAKRKEEKRKQAVEENAEKAIGMVEIQSAIYYEDTVPSDVVLSNLDLCNKKGSGPDLLVDAHITFSQGRRYGLVGKNGVGKSTFMEAFSNRDIHGMKWVKQNILLVKQEVEGNDMTAIEWLMRADGQRESLMQEINRLGSLADEESAESANKLGELHEKLSILDATKGEQQAKAILRGLGFSDSMQNAPTSSFSGGWRRRVALACALFVKPDILLLDEPTNHLDLETVLWLQNFVTSEEFTQTLLVVSHDRNFLNSVVTDIVLFRNHKLEVFKGDYFSFLKTMEQNKLTKQRQREAQEMKRQHLQEFITKHAQAGENGPKAARQRKSRMKKLERLGMEAASQNAGRKFKQSYDGEIEDVEEEQDEREITLSFPDPGKLDGTIIRLDAVEFKYPNNSVLHLKDIDMSLDQSSRVAILGRNGCGKSTLIKLITGKLNPNSGSVLLKQNGRIEYIAQHHSDKLDMESNALDTMLKSFPGDRSTSYINSMRQYLAKFGLVGTTLPNQKIATLSGGQKCRIALALALYKKPHFLIMDEPTNHLDMETTTALINAIKEYKGGILIVSHDEFLLKQACDELWYVKNNQLHKFNEGFNEYKKLVLKGKH
eukprot:CAMPEP_0184012384 /NCGR_PEP_ID=MMETSP0954-20121128/4376_1 /TAXON_ID=627963 /ORGANISM="Aplanochytrium sp, Strain PBS07" /LENGTH=737 /DNA_ID=CAMNT_0026292353 /DNA_START=75 /DNA_END=2288 /DNA_ORIENTATION=+